MQNGLHGPEQFKPDIPTKATWPKMHLNGPKLAKMVQNGRNISVHKKFDYVSKLYQIGDQNIIGWVCAKDNCWSYRPATQSWVLALARSTLIVVH